MIRIRNFLKTTIIGGLIVVLPFTIFVFAIHWLFSFVAQALEPLTNFVVSCSPIPDFVANVIIVTVIVVACFFVGLFVRTRLGRIIYELFEESLLSKAPGYTIIKETVNQFLGKKQSPFSSVALVQIFENQTMATAFITDTHADGSYTIFVPTGPNPTSGQIFHLQSDFVHPVDVSVEEAMRSIISCGAGSDKLIKALSEKK